MSKYVYDNHEIHEGMFVILQTLDALEGKYCGSLPDDIEEEMAQFKKHLISYVEPKDKYEDVDFADTSLICQYIYYKDDIIKYKKDRLSNKLKRNKNKKSENNNKEM